MRRSSALLAMLAMGLVAACSGAPGPEPGASPTASADGPSSSPSPSPHAAPAPLPSRTAPPVADPQGDPEVRAVWVHLFDDTLKTPESIDAMVDTVADANLNTIIVEVVRRHDAYYLGSEVLVRTQDPAVPEGFDVLAHVLERAAERGLSVQAWIPLMPAYHHVYDDLPRPDGWVWTEHGPDAPLEDRWVSRLADGTWDDHLDPGLPEVRGHVAAVAAEIAAKYPIDALHIDYVRYTDQDRGYHPRALERFRSETGAAGTPAPDDQAWSAWRRQQVDRMLEEIRSAVRAADPSLPLTAAVVAGGEGPTSGRPFEATRPYARFMQDWAGWIADGKLDAAMPMNYFDGSVRGDWFDQWAAFETALAQRTDVVIAGGQAGYLNRPDDSLAQLRTLRDGLDGVVLYSYQQTALDDPTDVLFELLPEELFEDRAPLPPPLGP